MRTNVEGQQLGPSRQTPGDNSNEVLDISTAVQKPSLPPDYGMAPNVKPKKDFDWNNIEVHIDAALLGEEQTLIMTMADLNSQPRTSKPCTFRDFDLSTLHHQISTEMGFSFDPTKYELQWQSNNNEGAFSVNRPGRYKVMLKRFSQQSQATQPEHILHLRITPATASYYIASHEGHQLNAEQLLNHLHLSDVDTDTDTGSDYVDSDREDDIESSPSTIENAEIEQLQADQDVDVSATVPEGYHPALLD